MKQKKFFLTITAIALVALGVLAFGDIDYQISKNMINQSSSFGLFFDYFGEMPANFGLLLATAILYGGRKRGGWIKEILLALINIPLMGLWSYMTVLAPFRYKFEFIAGGIPVNLMPLIYVITAVLWIATIVAIFKLGSERIRKYHKEGLALLLIIIVEMILVNVLKVIWARPRMRSITDISQFKHWYQINGPMSNEEFKSFPSGHTANSFVMIAYTMIFKSKDEKFKKNFMMLAVLWGTCVALSRVIMGAHFLSDVLVGGYLTVLIYFCFDGLMFNRKSKEA